jgi:hypothetical protein
MEKIGDLHVNINSKLKNIDYEDFKRVIKIMLYKLWMDAGSKMDKELFAHTVKSLSYSLYNYHSSLLFAEIQSIFGGISLGQYKCPRISSQSILGALNEYLEVKRKRVVYENDLKHQIERKRESYIMSSGLPIGSAIIFKMEQREKGLRKFDDVSLQEIAEKINSGELKILGKYNKH